MVAEMLATILIVEGDPGIAELERGRLEEAGYAIRVAAAADEALAEVRRGGVDLILLGDGPPSVVQRVLPSIGLSIATITGQVVQRATMPVVVVK